MIVRIGCDNLHKYRKFNNSDEARSWADNKYAEWLKTITKGSEREKSIYRYSGDDAGIFNSCLRGYENELIVKAEKPKINKLKEIINEGPIINEDIILYRHIPKGVVKEIREQKDDYIDSAFLSTSLTRDAARKANYNHGDKIAKLYIPKDIEIHSIFVSAVREMEGQDPFELEILLPPNTRWKIRWWQMYDLRLKLIGVG